MRVATAGVPHAAASVTVIPHPSRADALGQHPGPPVEVDHVVVVQVPGERDVALGTGVVDLRLELLAAVALAHDDELEVRVAGAQPDDRVDEELEALHRHEPADGDHERRRRLLAAGREARVDARRDHVHHRRP